MAYDAEKVPKLKHLKQMAIKIKGDYDSLSTKVTALENAGGEPNVLESVKVNGTALPIADKAVDISVPTKVSQLTNDSKFQSDTEVSTAIQTAIAATGHARFEKSATVPTAANAKDNVLYLVMNATTGHYDIYAKVENEVVLLDDTTVDLSGYVQKETGKGLSTNDFTTEEKNKLADIAAQATKVEASTTNGKIKINGTETTVYTEPGDVLHGAFATDAEVTEMLNEVFGVV